MKKIEINTKEDYLDVINKITDAVYSNSNDVLDLSQFYADLAAYESTFLYSGFGEREVEISIKLRSIAKTFELLSDCVCELRQILNKELMQ